VEAREAYKLINGNFEPREHQLKCWELIDDESPGILLLSGTGSGKTESILLPALFKNRKLIMVYPRRSLINDQIERVKRYLRTIVRNSFQSKTIVIDMGDEECSFSYYPLNLNDPVKDLIFLIKTKISFLEKKGKLLEIEVRNGENTFTFKSLSGLIESLPAVISKYKNFDLVFEIGAHTRISIEPNEIGSFFVKKSKRHYYGGHVILTTLDKFLYRFFGFGGSWNLIYPYRLLMGRESASKLIICFDEAHSYDGVSYTNFINLLSTLVAHNIKTVVMSATIPESFIDLARKKFGMKLVKGGDYKGNKCFQAVESNPEKRDEFIIKIVTNNMDKKTIIVRNTIQNAFRTYSELRSRIENTIPIYLYHGRQFAFTRERIYRELKCNDERNRPYVLVTTHAIEVGCDLNADILITDFCNPDQLIQRAGRCARIKESTGELYVLGFDFMEADDFMKIEDGFNYEEYRNILKMNSDGVLPEEDLRILIKPNLKEDEMTDALFQYLFSYIYEFDRMKEKLHESGILATRSWTPSVNLYWLKNQANLKNIKEMTKTLSLSDITDQLKEKGLLYNYDPLSISLDMFVHDGNISLNEFKDRVLILSVYDHESPAGYVKNTRINPYLCEIFVFYRSNEYPNYDPSNGLIKVPKIFQRENSRGFIDIVKIRKQFSIMEYDARIEYLNSRKMGF